jgi:esterase/lipase
MMIWVSGVLTALFLVGQLADALYAKRVETRYQQWDRTVTRDERGVRSEYAEIRMGEGDKAILFVHGFACPPMVYRHFAAHFASNGYHCAAIRLPGIGERMETASEVSRADWVEKVTREARLLRADHDEVWIVAHSLGAAVTLTALHADPSLADGLVLLAPLMRVGRERSPLAAPESLFRMGRPLLVRTRSVESIYPIDAHDPAVRDDPAREIFVPLNIYSEMFALLDELHEKKDWRPSVPVFMAQAQQDLVVDNATARAWFDDLDPQQRAYYKSPLAGHVLPLDTGWEALLERMARFVEQ